MTFSRTSRLTLASLALVLAGCGQTGPLYMPDDQAARERYDPGNAYGVDEQGQPVEAAAEAPQQATTAPESPAAASREPSEQPPIVSPPAGVPQPSSTPQTAAPQSAPADTPAPVTSAPQSRPEPSPAPATSTPQPQSQPQPPRVQQTLPASQGTPPPSGAERWRNVPFTPYPAAGGQPNRGGSQ